MSRPKTAPPELRRCFHCQQAVFDPVNRDVSDWPLIENRNASEHCTRCWMELAQTLGRPLGQPYARLENSWKTIPCKTSSAVSTA